MLQYFALHSKNIKAVVHNWAATNRGIRSYTEGEAGRRAGFFSRAAPLNLLQELMITLDNERQSKIRG